MKKSAKGAFAMVLVGALTFSVTNVLFSGNTLKQSAHAIASTISKEQTKTGDSGHSLRLPVQMDALTNMSSQNSGKENTGENTKTTQRLTTDGKNVQPSAQKVAAVQTDLHNDQTSTETAAAIQTVSVPAAAPIAVQTVHTATAPTTANTATPVHVNAPNTGTSSTASTSAANAKNPAPTPTTASSTKAAPKPTPTTTAATTTTNHGQQISQLAKEKAAAHKK